MSSRRPRRTRIYDTNYRLGESTYKSALDAIDRKYSVGGFRESSLPKPRLDFSTDAFDATLADARNRASRAITEETVFDSRGFKVPKVGVSLTESQSDFDREVQASLDKFRREKKKLLEDDLDFETKPVLSSFARRAEAEINDNLSGTKNTSESSSFIKRRALKVVAATENAIDQNDLTKWTRLDKAISSDATDAVELSKKRASATALRLRELDDDMIQREERQLARERRVANLKKFVHDELDTGLEDGIKAINY